MEFTDAITLEGQRVSLEPLSHRHEADLTTGTLGTEIKPTLYLSEQIQRDCAFWPYAAFSDIGNRLISYGDRGTHGRRRTYPSECRILV